MGHFGGGDSGSSGGGGGGSGATTLNELTDVVVNSPTTGQVLKYNGSAWVNGTDSTGGGGGSLTGDAYVVWEPSDSVGGSNMASELEDFIHDNQGKEVWFQNGVTVLLNGFGSGLSDSDDVEINATNATILYDSGQKCVVVDNTGNASAEVTVSSISTQTVNTDARVSRVTIGSTLGIQKFDVVAIYSSNANPAISGGKLGEIIQVMTDETALVFDTMERLRRGSTYSSSIKCRKLDKTRKFRWRGGKFKANGDANDAGITSRLQCIHIYGFVNPIIRDVEFDRPWAMCIDLQCCAFGLVENMQVYDVANLASSNGFTYGVRTYGMNYGHTIRNIKVRNGRHPAFTTDGNTSSSTWYQVGIPTNIMVHGITAINCHGTVVDTHEEGDGIIIDGVESINPVQLSTSSLTGTLAQLRCANTILRNVVQIGGARVIKVSAVEHGFRDKIVIQGVSAMGLADGLDTDAIIEVEDQSALTNKRDVQVTDVNATDVGLAFLIGKKAPVSLDRIYLSKVDSVGDVYGGAEITVGSMTVDYRNNTRSPTNYVWKCRSDSTNGGCKIIHAAKPIIYKGSTSNNPLHFFDERDTTATKTVFVPGFVEYNPSAVNATLLYESGATTFTQAADVVLGDLYPQTITAGGTTGAQTINKYKGRVNFAAGASSLVVTNNLVTANSMIICTIATNDSTAILKNVVPGSGSFTIRTTANVTGETAVDFFVINGF